MLTPHQHQVMSEKCLGADQTLCNPKPHSVFKKRFPEVHPEFRSFEHQLPILFLGPVLHCPFLHHHLVLVDWFYCVQASRPKFGSPKTVMRLFLICRPTWGQLTFLQYGVFLSMKCFSSTLMSLMFFTYVSYSIQILYCSH